MVFPVCGTSPSYEPISGRDYDTFGGFFDQYGQYVDPLGGVMDRYGEYVPDSYSPSCDTYRDSKGQVYGFTTHAGQLREGDWLFGNIDTFKIEWPSSIHFTRNSDCNLVGTYYNSAGRPYTITIHETRRYLGTTEDQIALNLKDIANPKTQEKLFTETGHEKELARMMLQNKFIDDEGYINLIYGDISNPDSSSCSAWNVGFSGYSFENGKRFRATYWSCFVCKGPDGALEEGDYHCLILYTDPISEDNRAVFWPWAALAEEDIDGDWLDDGQDITNPEKADQDAPMHGYNPLADVDWGDIPINLE